MTNEEAINEICDLANVLQIMYKSKKGQAFEMAISALKNNYNSAENNYKMQDFAIKVDLISREYALKQIEIAEEKGVNFTFETLKDFIKILPTYFAKEDTAENITWVVNDSEEAVAFKNVKVDKVIEICEILGDKENNYNSAEQTDGDLISRNNAIELVNYALAENKDVLEVLENMPSAEKTAEWKLVDAYRGLYACSNCKLQSSKYAFCPNCGAKMKVMDKKSGEE